MCWSGEASTLLASAGLITTGYAAYKKESKELWIPLGYFSLMEVLQAFTYSVINQCSVPSKSDRDITRLFTYCFSASFYKYDFVIFYSRGS